MRKIWQYLGRFAASGLLIVALLAVSNTAAAQTIITTEPTIAALVGLTPPPTPGVGDVILVANFADTGDGGGGSFVLTAAQQATAALRSSPSVACNESGPDNGPFTVHCSAVGTLPAAFRAYAQVTIAGTTGGSPDYNTSTPVTIRSTGTSFFTYTRYHPGPADPGNSLGGTATIALADDGCIVFAPTAAALVGNVWVRQNVTPGVVNADWCGAGVNTKPTEFTTLADAVRQRIQKAINLANNNAAVAGNSIGATVQLSNRTYPIDWTTVTLPTDATTATGLVVPSGVTLSGVCGGQGAGGSGWQASGSVLLWQPGDLRSLTPILTVYDAANARVNCLTLDASLSGSNSAMPAVSNAKYTIGIRVWADNDPPAGPVGGPPTKGIELGWITAKVVQQGIVFGDPTYPQDLLSCHTNDTALVTCESASALPPAWAIGYRASIGGTGKHVFDTGAAGLLMTDTGGAPDCGAGNYCFSYVGGTSSALKLSSCTATGSGVTCTATTNLPTASYLTGTPIIVVGTVGITPPTVDTHGAPVAMTTVPGHPDQFTFSSSASAGTTSGGTVAVSPHVPLTGCTAASGTATCTAAATLPASFATGASVYIAGMPGPPSFNSNHVPVTISGVTGTTQFSFASSANGTTTSTGTATLAANVLGNPPLALGTCTNVSGSVTCNTALPLGSRYAIGTQVLLTGTGAGGFDTGAIPVTITVTTSTSFSFTARSGMGPGPTSTGVATARTLGIAIPFDNSQSDWVNLHDFFLTAVGNANSTCVHVNQGNVLQASTISRGACSSFDDGVDLLYSNGDFKIEYVANGGTAASGVSDAPTFIHVRPTYIATYSLYGIETENSNAFAYAVHDSSCYTVTPAVSSVWEFNQFGMPVAVDGCSHVTSIGNLDAVNGVQALMPEGVWGSVTPSGGPITSFNLFQMKANPSDPSGTMEPIFAGTAVTDGLGHSTTTSSYVAASSDSITLPVNSTPLAPGGFNSSGCCLTVGGLVYTGIDATDVTLAVDPLTGTAAKIPANTPVWMVTAGGSVVATYTTADVSSGTTTIPVRSTAGMDPSGTAYIAYAAPFIVAGTAAVTSIGDRSLNMPGPSGSAWMNQAPATAHLSSLGGTDTGAAQHTLEVLRANVVAQPPAYLSTAGSSTVHCSLNAMQHILLSGNAMLTLDSLLPGQQCLVDIEEDAAGGRMPTWAVSPRYTLKWDGGGVQPAQGTTAGANYLWRFAAQDSNTVIGDLLDTTNASNLTGGTLSTGRLPAMTGGDCTTAAGSGSIVCAPFPRTFMRANHYVPIPPYSAVSTAALTNGVLRVAAFTVPRAITISALDVEVTSAGDTGSTVRLCIYADDGTGYPGALATGGDAGSVAGDGAAGQREISGLSISLTPGVYWIGTVAQNVSVTGPTVRTALVASFAGPTTQPPATASINMGYAQSGISNGSGCPSSFTNVPVASVAQARIYAKVN